AAPGAGQDPARDHGASGGGTRPSLRLRDSGDAPEVVRPPPSRQPPGLPGSLRRRRHHPHQKGNGMNIAIPIFDRLTALDAVGPYEVLARLPEAEVQFLAAEPGPKRTETRMLALTADATLDSLPDPEVIVVPGGYGTRALMADEAILS